MKKSLPQTLIATALALCFLFPSPTLAATSSGFLGGFFSSLYSTVVSLFTFSPDATPSSTPSPTPSPSGSASPSYSSSLSPSPSGYVDQEFGVCCIATWDDKYCGSSPLNSKKFEENAKFWLLKQDGCSKKIPMSITDFQSTTTPKKLLGQCSSVRLKQFQHGPALESLMTSVKICVSEYKCDVTANSSSCQTFKDITEAYKYLEDLKKNIPQGVRVTVSGNQADGITNIENFCEAPNNTVEYTVTKEKIDCQVSWCAPEGGMCNPVGDVTPRCRSLKGETFQRCCESKDSKVTGAGTWYIPGEDCPAKYACTGTNPLEGDKDYLYVACYAGKLYRNEPYEVASIGEGCIGTCKFRCSSIAEYKDGKCVPKSTSSPSPSASYYPSPSYSPTYSPSYSPTPSYSYSPSPSYSPSSTYTPTYSPSPSQTVSATPKKSSSFMASVASGFKSIIDGVAGMFR